MNSRRADFDPASAENVASFVDVIERASERWWPLSTVLVGWHGGGGPDNEKLWHALVEAGATAVGLEETLGGIGAGVLGAVAVIESAAHALQPAGLLATTGLTTPLLNALIGTSAEDHARDLAARIVGGQRASVAVAPRLHVSAERRLRGQLHSVVDADVSDFVVVIIGDGASTGIVVVEPSAAGGVVPIDALDETRGYADIRLDLDLSGESVLLEGDAAAAIVDPAILKMTLAVAADSVGGAQRAVTETVEYARMREQFGRPIGSFQALRHLIVDTHVCVQQAAACVRQAARAIAWDSHAARVDVHIAKALATDAYIRAASTCVQVHGGIGFTRGIPAHLHVKRARANEALFGSGSWHRARLGELLACEVPEDW